MYIRHDVLSALASWTVLSLINSVLGGRVWRDYGCQVGCKSMRTGAGRGREYEIASPRARVDNIARMHQRMRASN